MHILSPRRWKIFPAALLAGLAASANAQVAIVANAASMISNTPLAPGSIITIFGTSLAHGVAVTSDPANPPQTLGGTSVTVGGVAAGLYYVSPRQINAVMGATTPVGQQTLTVTSPDGAFSATVAISQSAPPGIFSLTGTGTHDGAILNAVTFALGAFTVNTEKGATFLAIFLTGLNLSTAPVVTVGGAPVTVQFYGKTPCCEGMEQINVQLAPSLAGAGRVEVVVESGGLTSNAVEVVLLPDVGQGAFPDDLENETPSRELAGIAYVPGTSLALVADENDDVVRVVDVSKQQVTQIIALPTGAGPVAIAVNASGTTAVVAERGTAQAAIIDLASFKVTAQVSVGLGPLSVAIAGDMAVVVNGDAGTVSFVGVSTANALAAPLATGSGARGVAVDPVALKAYVTNEDSGTVTVMDLSTFTVSNTIPLGANIRPAAIQLIPGSTLAVIAVPGAGDNGEALVLNVSDGTVNTINVNPDRSGGSSDVAVNGTTAYFADQTGGAVSFVPISVATGQPTAAPTIIKTDLGARALAIDTKDNLLLVSNEGGGTVVLVDLASGQVTGRIIAVRSNEAGDDGEDDHSDRNKGANAPVVTSIAPSTVSSTSTFTLTITGTNLLDVTKVVFINPANVKGNGNGESAMSGRDKAFVVGSMQPNSGGTQLTVAVTVTGAAPGPRLVVVGTKAGISSLQPAAANTLTVVP